MNEVESRHDDNWPDANPWRRGVIGLPYGWTNKASISVDDWRDYNKVVEWLFTNIENSKANVHWVWLGNEIFLQFRKAKDFTLFSLRWGA